MNQHVTQPMVSRGPLDDGSPPPVPPETTARFWSRTSRLKEIRGLLRAVEAWPGAAIVPDCFGLNLSLGDVALGHLRWDGRIHLSFRPELRDRLVAEAMADLDPEEPGAARVVFELRTPADVERATWLLRLAFLSLDSIECIE